MTTNPGDTRKLIYDVGAHTGEDTDFYLGKGFRVVAVEANPQLVKQLNHRFADEISRGDLVVVSRAIGRDLGATVRFFINSEKDDWSSLDRDTAAKGGAMPVEEIEVETVRLQDLFDEFGVPYYLKVDIELGDADVAAVLLGVSELPRYASFELHEPRVMALLASAGYTEFQLTNQWLNGLLTPIVPAREGTDYWPGGMGGHHSGLFGAELPPDEWRGLVDIMELYLAQRLVSRFGLMKTAWFDIHARRAEN